MATSIGPTYDPTSTATALAQKYTSGRQEILDARSKAANALEGGLTKLGSAITAFQTSLASLTGINKELFAQSATFSDTTLGSASAKASATAGTYSFFVKQLATANQVSYAGIKDDTDGSLKVMVGTTPITVDLSGGPKTARQVAAAINAASENTGLVTASVITTGTGVSELVLTAKKTGGASAITLDTSGLVDATQSLSTANPDPDPLTGHAGRMKVLVPANDAIIEVGGQGGTPITRATNTFDVIDDVTLTFTKAQASGAAPLTVTVGPDNDGTVANVQAFIDAYNKLKNALDDMVDAGDPSKGVGGGVFAHDGGIRALRDRLVTLMRPAGSASLASFGIRAEKTGTLELKAERLTRQLTTDPHGLDNLIGNASAAAPTGIAGDLDKFLKGWSSTTGKIQKRKEENGQVQQDVIKRQAYLDTQYDAAYKRYLLQFTQLQSLQSQMSTNVTMFDALFGNDKSK